MSHQLFAVDSSISAHDFVMLDLCRVSVDCQSSSAIFHFNRTYYFCLSYLMTLPVTLCRPLLPHW